MTVSNLQCDFTIGIFFSHNRSDQSCVQPVRQLHCSLVRSASPRNSHWSLCQCHFQLHVFTPYIGFIKVVVVGLKIGFSAWFLDKRIGNAMALFHMTTVLIWLTKGLITWLVDWLIDWLPDSLINKLTDWLSNWLTDWLTQCLIHWLADCLTEFLTDSLIEWLSYCLTYWLKDQLANWMTHWLTNRLPDDWPTGKLAHSLTV